MKCWRGLAMKNRWKNFTGEKSRIAKWLLFCPMMEIKT